MNAFSKIDMAEVTRLTRAGKLAEAMALLRGGGAPTAGERPGGRFRPLSQAVKLTGIKDMIAALRDKAVSFADPGEGRASSPATPQGARFEERTYASAAGSRNYKVYVPSGYKGQPLPVVTMLHGCTQNPDDFAAGTRMNELAEEQTLLVVYPRQPQSANAQKCWNWFDAENQRRDGGEASLIAGLVREVVGEFSADASRVYVAGLSAGGAAAANLAQTHPDVFAAVGVHSGLACGAAKDMPSAFAAMARGGAFSAKGAGATVPTIVFHGDADRTVNPVNAEQVVAQAKPDASLTEVEMRGQTPDGMTYTRTVRLDVASREVVEQWTLHGAGHAWSGGSLDGSFTDPRGPDASREMIRFFLQHRI